MFGTGEPACSGVACCFKDTNAHSRSKLRGGPRQMLGERKSACVLVQPQKKNPPAKASSVGEGKQVNLK